VEYFALGQFCHFFEREKLANCPLRQQWQSSNTIQVALGRSIAIDRINESNQTLTWSLLGVLVKVLFGRFSSAVIYSRNLSRSSL
jgi:hypothetical protein